MEEWRNVPGCNGIYQINIGTKEGKCRCICFQNSNNTKELSNKPDKRDGRVFWTLRQNNRRTKRQAAAWIALTFPELVENEYFVGAEIDHKDTDRLNNQPSNLRWVTHKENCNNPLTIKNLSESHLNSSKTIEQFNKDMELVAVFQSISEASRITSVRRSSISLCCSGKFKTAGGFIWRYA